jgi:hypothetical protein
LDHLPEVQAYFYFVSIGLLAGAVAIRTGSWLFSLVFAVIAGSSPYLDFGGVMSDMSYAAWLALGFAALSPMPD